MDTKELGIPENPGGVRLFKNSFRELCHDRQQRSSKGQRQSSASEVLPSRYSSGSHSVKADDRKRTGLKSEQTEESSSVHVESVISHPRVGDRVSKQPTNTGKCSGNCVENDVSAPSGIGKRSSETEKTEAQDCAFDGCVDKFGKCPVSGRSSSRFSEDTSRRESLSSKKNNDCVALPEGSRNSSERKDKVTLDTNKGRKKQDLPSGSKQPSGPSVDNKAPLGQQSNKTGVVESRKDCRGVGRKRDIPPRFRSLRNRQSNTRFSPKKTQPCSQQPAKKKEDYSRLAVEGSKATEKDLKRSHNTCQLSSSSREKADFSNNQFGEQGNTERHARQSPEEDWENEVRITEVESVKYTVSITGKKLNSIGKAEEKEGLRTGAGVLHSKEHLKSSVEKVEEKSLQRNGSKDLNTEVNRKVEVQSSCGFDAEEGAEKVDQKACVKKGKVLSRPKVGSKEVIETDSKDVLKLNSKDQSSPSLSKGAFAASSGKVKDQSELKGANTSQSGSEDILKEKPKDWPLSSGEARRRIAGERQVVSPSSKSPEKDRSGQSTVQKKGTTTAYKDGRKADVFKDHSHRKGTKPAKERFVSGDNFQRKSDELKTCDTRKEISYSARTVKESSTEKNKESIGKGTKKKKNSKGKRRSSGESNFTSSPEGLKNSRKTLDQSVESKESHQSGSGSNWDSNRSGKASDICKSGKTTEDSRKVDHVVYSTNQEQTETAVHSPLNEHSGKGLTNSGRSTVVCSKTSRGDRTKTVCPREDSKKADSLEPSWANTGCNRNRRFDNQNYKGHSFDHKNSSRPLKEVDKNPDSNVRIRDHSSLTANNIKGTYSSVDNKSGGQSGQQSGAAHYRVVERTKDRYTRDSSHKKHDISKRTSPPISKQSTNSQNRSLLTPNHSELESPKEPKLLPYKETQDSCDCVDSSSKSLSPVDVKEKNSPEQKKVHDFKSPKELESLSQTDLPLAKKVRKPLTRGRGKRTDVQQLLDRKPGLLNRELNKTNQVSCSEPAGSLEQRSVEIESPNRRSPVLGSGAEIKDTVLKSGGESFVQGSGVKVVGLELTSQFVEKGTGEITNRVKSEPSLASFDSEKVESPNLTSSSATWHTVHSENWSPSLEYQSDRHLEEIEYTSGRESTGLAEFGSTVNEPAQSENTWKSDQKSGSEKSEKGVDRKLCYQSKQKSKDNFHSQRSPTYRDSESANPVLRRCQQSWTFTEHWSLSPSQPISNWNWPQQKRNSSERYRKNRSKNISTGSYSSSDTSQGRKPVSRNREKRKKRSKKNSRYSAGSSTCSSPQSGGSLLSSHGKVSDRYIDLTEESTRKLTLVDESCLRSPEKRKEAESERVSVSSMPEEERQKPCLTLPLTSESLQKLTGKEDGDSESLHRICSWVADNTSITSFYFHTKGHQDATDTTGDMEVQQIRETSQTRPCVKQERTHDDDKEVFDRNANYVMKEPGLIEDQEHSDKIPEGGFDNIGSVVKMEVSDADQVDNTSAAVTSEPQEMDIDNTQLGEAFPVVKMESSDSKQISDTYKPCMNTETEKILESFPDAVEAKTRVVKDRGRWVQGNFSDGNTNQIQTELPGLEVDVEAVNSVQSKISTRVDHTETSGRADHTVMSGHTCHTETSSCPDHTEMSVCPDCTERSVCPDCTETRDCPDCTETSDCPDCTETSDCPVCTETSGCPDHTKANICLDRKETGICADHTETSDHADSPETGDHANSLETGDHIDSVDEVSDQAVAKVNKEMSENLDASVFDSDSREEVKRPGSRCPSEASSDDFFRGEPTFKIPSATPPGSGRKRKKNHNKRKVSTNIGNEEKKVFRRQSRTPSPCGRQRNRSPYGRGSYEEEFSPGNHSDGYVRGSPIYNHQGAVRMGFKCQPYHSPHLRRRPFSSPENSSPECWGYPLPHVGVSPGRQCGINQLSPPEQMMVMNSCRLPPPPPPGFFDNKDTNFDPLPPPPGFADFCSDNRFDQRLPRPPPGFSSVRDDSGLRLHQQLDAKHGFRPRGCYHGSVQSLETDNVCVVDFQRKDQSDHRRSFEDFTSDVVDPSIHVMSDYSVKDSSKSSLSPEEQAFKQLKYIARGRSTVRQSLTDSFKRPGPDKSSPEGSVVHSSSPGECSVLPLIRDLIADDSSERQSPDSVSVKVGMESDVVLTTMLNVQEDGSVGSGGKKSPGTISLDSWSNPASSSSGESISAIRICSQSSDVGFTFDTGSVMNCGSNEGQKYFVDDRGLVTESEDEKFFDAEMYGGSEMSKSSADEVDPEDRSGFIGPRQPKSLQTKKKDVSPFTFEKHQRARLKTMRDSVPKMKVLKRGEQLHDSAMPHTKTEAEGLGKPEEQKRVQSEGAAQTSVPKKWPQLDEGKVGNTTASLAERMKLRNKDTQGIANGSSTESDSWFGHKKEGEQAESKKAFPVDWFEQGSPENISTIGSQKSEVAFSKMPTMADLNPWFSKYDEQGTVEMQFTKESFPGLSSAGLGSTVTAGLGRASRLSSTSTWEPQRPTAGAKMLHQYKSYDAVKDKTKANKAFPWRRSTGSIQPPKDMTQKRKSWSSSLGHKEGTGLYLPEPGSAVIPENSLGHRSFSWDSLTDLVEASGAGSATNSPARDWKLQFKNKLGGSDVPYVDSHCHIDFIYKRTNFRGSWSTFQTLYQETFMPNYNGCVTNFCDPGSFRPGGIWNQIINEDGVFSSFGCHPKSATEFTEEREEFLKYIIKHPKVVSLGEIGLDYAKGFDATKDIQKEVFIKQLKLAVENNLPLVIHCREAEEDCLGIMMDYVPHDYKIHRHCFTGKWDELEPWLEYFTKCYVGLTPLVTFKSAVSVHDVARRIPLERLILETDAPYFRPPYVPKDELQYSTPGMAICVAHEVARLRGTEMDDVLLNARSNTMELYGV